MPEFHIIKQQNLQLGCIPACAASVLEYHAIEGNWNEAGILQMWAIPNGSGFERLKTFLQQDGRLPGWTTVIKGRADVDLGAFLRQERQPEGNPVLFAINQGQHNPDTVWLSPRPRGTTVLCLIRGPNVQMPASFGTISSAQFGRATFSTSSKLLELQMRVARHITRPTTTLPLLIGYVKSN